MPRTFRKTIYKYSIPVVCFGILLAVFVFGQSVHAIDLLPEPDPIPGAYGLEARKNQPPPVRGATITTPGNSTSFSTSPVTVNGTCPDGLLVQIFNNDVMVGAAMCESGSFSLQVSLFSGTNDLTALVYDALGQSGPRSNIMSVTYVDEDLEEFGQLITLTSQYGRLSAAATTPLKWPLQLTGGTGPYAFSIDWGDGSGSELMSRSLAGAFNIDHVYKRAGIYIINIKVTDVNDVSAFLQLIAVSNGEVDNSIVGDANDQEEKSDQPKILWLPVFLMWFLLIPAYWLGRHSMKVSLRNKMLKERDAYANDKSPGSSVDS